MLADDKILTIVGAELADTDSISDGSSGNLIDSMKYYLGSPNGKEVTGRSEVTSTDVADAIEWIMPQIMESFTQNNEVVIFDPAFDGDEQQAEMESEYVYDVLMKDNPGFVLLYQFVKDALMQKVGILKVYYENVDNVTAEEFTGITREQLLMLLAEETVELIELTENVITNDGMPMAPLYDVKVRITESEGRIIVEGVPREQFRINSDHNSIDPTNARFTAHVTEKTVSDLLLEGLIKKKEDADDLPEGTIQYDKDYRFTIAGHEASLTKVSEDPSQKTVQISECYMMMDINDDGISEYVKVTVAGDDGSPTDVLSIEEIDHNPWVCTTAIIMSHKFDGLSIFDRLKEIQDQKTSLWRNMFDNLYLQNNQRTAVVENQVNLDDLMVSRPGGIVRVKRLDAIQPLATPQIGQDAYSMMEYLDQVRAGRTGVSADGNASPQSIGDRVGSQGVARLMNAKEALVGLMVRVVSETGVKPLCIKIRDLSVAHIDAVRDYKFKGVWHKVNPAQWRSRKHSTVRVGTGTGDHAQQIIALEKVIAAQEKVLANPSQTMVREEQIFAAFDDFCKLNGLNSAVKYFIDPSSPEGQQRKQIVDKNAQANQMKEEQMQKAMAEAQINLSKAEMSKAQAQMAGVQFKAQNDNMKNKLVQMKQVYDAEVRLLEIELQEAQNTANDAKSLADIAYKYEDLNKRMALELTRIEVDSMKEENNNYSGNVRAISNE